MGFKFHSGNIAPFFSWPEVGFLESTSFHSFEYLIAILNTYAPGQKVFRIVDQISHHAEDLHMMIIDWKGQSWWLIAYSDKEMLESFNTYMRENLNEGYNVKEIFEFSLRSIVGSYGQPLGHPSYNKKILDDAFGRFRNTNRAEIYYASDLAHLFFNALYRKTPEAKAQAEEDNVPF